MQVNESTYSAKEASPITDYLDTRSSNDNRIGEIPHAIGGIYRLRRRANGGCPRWSQTVTVYELIQLLRKHATDLRVVDDGYEDGYDDLSPEQIRVVKISLNTGKHRWEGAHGDLDDLPSDSKVVEALVLRQSSN